MNLVKYDLVEFTTIAGGRIGLDYGFVLSVWGTSVELFPIRFAVNCDNWKFRTGALLVSRDNIMRKLAQG